MKNKEKEIFGLNKLPDEALIRYLRIELGKCNSYINELEEKIKSINNTDCDLCKRQIKNIYKNEIKSLNAKIDKKQKENDRLRFENNQMRERLKRK